MPIYVYEVVLPGDEAGQRFEVMQRMSDPVLTHHPSTGQPVRRVIQPPHLAGPWSESGTRAALSDRNLAEKGFTKYVKTDDGRYEKTTSDGPGEIAV